MAEKEEKVEEIKIEDKTSEEKKDTKKKSSAGKIVLIVLAVLLVIALLCGGFAMFAYRTASDRITEITEVEDTLREVEQEVTREIDEMEREVEEVVETEEAATQGDEPKVDEELLQRDLLSERFPEDIPLSGGKLRESSFDQWSVSAVIMTSSSVEEAYLWYEEALEDTDWVITSKSRQDNRANISFNNDAEDREDRRNVDITIMDSVWGYTNITIRERY